MLVASTCPKQVWSGETKDCEGYGMLNNAWMEPGKMWWVTGKNIELSARPMKQASPWLMFQQARIGRGLSRGWKLCGQEEQHFSSLEFVEFMIYSP